MSRRNIGIIVAGNRKDVDNPEPVLDSNEKQFKWDRIVDIVVTIPKITPTTIGADATWSKDIEYFFNKDKSSIGYFPMIDYRIKCSYSGIWGSPVRDGGQSSSISVYSYPYHSAMMGGIVDDKSFSITLFIWHRKDSRYTPPTYPAHTAVIRLYVALDGTKKV